MAIDTTRPRSRRAILLGALGGAVAAAAAAAGRASPVSAANGDTAKVGGRYSATALTEFDATGQPALGGSSDVSWGVSGHSDSSYGVVGDSTSAGGVWGKSYSSYGVYGTSSSSIAVYGDANRSPRTGVEGVSGSGFGVYGYSDSGQGLHGGTGSGIGVFGDNSSNTLPAVEGWSKGGNTGIQGHSGAGTPDASPPHTGVFGSAPAGRGGQFSGGQAQLRLVPSADANHPASGAAGDLFLDKSHRLWLCKGGQTWKLLG